LINKQLTNYYYHLNCTPSSLHQQVKTSVSSSNQAMTGFKSPATLAVTIVAFLLTAVSGGSLRRLDAMEYQAVMIPSLQNCFIENGFDYVDNDIGNSPGSVDTCCNQCNSFGGCKAWSWSNYNGGTCWFKKAVGTIIVNPNVKSARLFYKYVPYCQLEENTDYVDNDIANKPSVTADGCCAICQSTLGCRAYSWSNHNGGTCWLKSAVGQKIYKAGVKAAMAYPVDGGGSNCPVPTNGIDYVDNDIGNKPSPTPEGCCEICKNFPKCRAYAWTNQNGGTCWLKSAKGQTIVKAGVWSAQVYENLPVTCSAIENDMDYIDNDIGNVPAGDSSLCCALCGANGGCKAWSWSNYNGGTCWLKSAKGQNTYKAGVKSATLVVV
jgi:hypothetical protein